MSVAFGNLYKACLKRDMKATLHIFEGGETITVRNLDGDKLLFSSTSEYGDVGTTASHVAQHLLKAGLLDTADLEG